MTGRLSFAANGPSGGKHSSALEKEKQPKKNPASTFNAPEKEKQPKKNPASTFNAPEKGETTEEKSGFDF